MGKERDIFIFLMEVTVQNIQKVVFFLSIFMKEILHFKLPDRIQPFELILISEWIRPENSAGYTKRTDFLVFPPHIPNFGRIEHKARQADSHIYL